MKLACATLLIAVLLFNAALMSGRSPVSSCRRIRLFREHRVSVWSIPDRHSIIYKSGFAVDADGASRAYHPDDQSGLDSLAHAGHPGNWWALVTNNEKRSGRPVLQGESDPAPGFYVSTTALFDPGNPNVRDPRRYVDAEEIPYVVLPPRALKFARLGDFATVVNLQNGKVAAAIVADKSTPRLPVGEGSIALADALDIDSDPRSGGRDRDVAYIIYRGSGNGRPRELQEISDNAERLFEAWGGLDKLKSCFADQ